MRTYIYQETDSPERGCNVRIIVHRIKQNRPLLVGHSNHNTASWYGTRAQAQQIIHEVDGLPWKTEHYELKNLLGFVDLYDQRKGPGIRLFSI